MFVVDGIPPVAFLGLHHREAMGGSELKVKVKVKQIPSEKRADYVPALVYGIVSSCMVRIPEWSIIRPCNSAPIRPVESYDED